MGKKPLYFSTTSHSFSLFVWCEFILYRLSCQVPNIFNDHKEKVMFSQVFVHNPPHGYSFTTHPCYCAVGTHPTGILSCHSCVRTEVD